MDLEYGRWANAEMVEKPLNVVFDRMFQKDWGVDFYEEAQPHLDRINGEIDAVHALMDDLEPDDEARFRARRWRDEREKRGDSDPYEPKSPNA